MHGHMNVKSKDMFEQNLTAHSYNLNWKKKIKHQISVSYYTHLANAKLVP